MHIVSPCPDFDVQKTSISRHKGDSKSRSHRSSSRTSSKGGPSSSGRTSKSRNASSDIDNIARTSVEDRLLQESSQRWQEEKRGMFRPSSRSHASVHADDDETESFDVDTLVQVLADSVVNSSEEE